MTRRGGQGGEPVNLGEWTGHKETEKALLVTSDIEPDMWVPKSVIHDDSEVYGEGHTGDLIVQRWWAEANGHA